MYTVSVTLATAGGSGLHVQIGGAVGTILQPVTAEPVTEQPDEGPSPIAPEAKELLWGLGAFLVFLVLMRFWLVPKLKDGMAARYATIRGGHEHADTLRSDAEREVAEYDEALAAVRAEGAARVEAGSRQLEAERSERLEAVNAAIAERKAAAAAENDAARIAARSTIEAAVVDVASRAVELGLGRRPDGAAVRAIAEDVIGVGVGS